MELESEMLELGSNRMRTRIELARKKRDMNRLRPYRNLLTEWVEPLAKYINDWVTECKGKRGPNPQALKYIEKLTGEVCAMVTLRSVLRMVGLERRAILSIAYEIGTFLEHEDRARAWKDQDREGWNALASVYKNRGSNAAHQKRSRIVVFNKHVRENIEWEDWSDNIRRRVGLDLIDMLCTSNGRFKVVKDKSPRAKRGKKNAHPYVLEADPDLLMWLEDALGAEEVHKPAYLPTLMPPKQWEGPRDGGYWTPYVKSPFLIRFKASNEDQRQRAIDEYDALDMPLVYEALNTVQETPWQINKRVYEVAKHVWDQDLTIAGFARREPEVVPTRPDLEDREDERYKEWAKEASGVHTRNAQRVSHYISQHRTIMLAERFLQEDEFYFPHMLDFRGRMYPIPADLQPQGGDLQRGLLTFKNGTPVSEEDSAWLAVHLANSFGMDKISYNDRIAWVYDNLDLWKRISASPLQQRDWLGADGGDKAWRGLAAAIEFQRYVDEGPGMISSLPIHVDGTCNGIQHLSAMVRDEDGGRAVNLLNSDEPNDIYQDVADTLTEVVKSSDSDIAKRWLAVTEGRLPRSLTKRPVMILPYGGSRQAFIKYILDWLTDNDPKALTFALEERWEASYWLAGKLWDSVREDVKRPLEVMEWIQKTSKVTSQTGLPMYWVTPAGFVVRHFYGKRDEKQITTNIDGQRMVLAHWEISPHLDKKSQAQGIAPNFVHSMDASALMSSVLLAKSFGVQNITTIHDAYGATAGEMMVLSKAIREAFVKTYEIDVLSEFRDSCINLTGDNDNYPLRPEMGTLELSDVQNSDYFFA